MEFLFNLVQQYVEWRAQIPSVYFSGWGAIIGALASVAISAMANRGGGGNNANLNTLASFEAAEAARRNQIQRELFSLVENTPSAMEAILGAGGFRLPRNLEQARDGSFSNLSEILGSIDFTTANRIDGLSSLLGQTQRSTAATSQLAALNAASQAQQDDDIANIVNSLVVSLMNNRNTPSTQGDRV